MSRTKSFSENKQDRKRNVWVESTVGFNLNFEVNFQGQVHFGTAHAIVTHIGY